MPLLQCYVDDAKFVILDYISRKTGRKIEELAEAAIQNEAVKAAQSERLPVTYPLNLGCVTIGMTEMADGSIRIVP